MLFARRGRHTLARQNFDAQDLSRRQNIRGSVSKVPRRRSASKCRREKTADFHRESGSSSVLFINSSHRWISSRVRWQAAQRWQATEPRVALFVARLPATCHRNARAQSCQPRRYCHQQLLTVCHFPAKLSAARKLRRTNRLSSRFMSRHRSSGSQPAQTRAWWHCSFAAIVTIGMSFLPRASAHHRKLETKRHLCFFETEKKKSNGANLWSWLKYVFFSNLKLVKLAIGWKLVECGRLLRMLLLDPFPQFISGSDRAFKHETETFCQCDENASKQSIKVRGPT